MKTKKPKKTTVKRTVTFEPGKIRLLELNAPDDGSLLSRGARKATVTFKPGTFRLLEPNAPDDETRD